MYFTLVRISTPKNNPGKTLYNHSEDTDFEKATRELDVLKEHNCQHYRMGHVIDR